MIVHLLDAPVSVIETAFMLHCLYRKQYYLEQCQKDLQTHAFVAGNTSIFRVL